MKLAARQTSIGAHGLLKRWRFNSWAGCPDGAKCTKSHEAIPKAEVTPGLAMALARFGGHKASSRILPGKVDGFVEARRRDLEAELASKRNDEPGQTGKAKRTKAK